MSSSSHLMNVLMVVRKDGVNVMILDCFISNVDPDVLMMVDDEQDYDVIISRLDILPYGTITEIAKALKKRGFSAGEIKDIGIDWKHSSGYYALDDLSLVELQKQLDRSIQEDDFEKSILIRDKMRERE